MKKTIRLFDIQQTSLLCFRFLPEVCPGHHLAPKVQNLDESEVVALLPRHPRLLRQQVRRGRGGDHLLLVRDLLGAAVAAEHGPAAAARGGRALVRACVAGVAAAERVALQHAAAPGARRGEGAQRTLGDVAAEVGRRGADAAAALGLGAGQPHDVAAGVGGVAEVAPLLLRLGRLQQRQASGVFPAGRHAVLGVTLWIMLPLVKHIYKHI